MKTLIISSFPGTGKTHFCEKYEGCGIELECWEYSKSDNFPNNIVLDIKSFIGKIKYIFISTNNIVLDKLIKEEIGFQIYYPSPDQKEDYMNRYVKRKSPYDFIGVMYVHWDDWLDVASKYGGTVLKQGEHLSDKILK